MGSARRTAGETLFTSSVFFPSGTFTTGIEGPACDAAGNLYAVSYLWAEAIGVVTPEGVDSLYVELPSGSTGNGIRFDSHGDMLVADYTGNSILKVDSVTGEISTLAHDSTMYQPNDIAIDANDIVYASDPRRADSTGQIWRITPDGAITRIATGLGWTNGIEVSSDGKTLYVNETTQYNVWAFDVSSAGELSNKRLIINLSGTKLDGMRADTAGNLYVTRQAPTKTTRGAIAVVSPAGEILHTVTLLGKKPTNIAFGGSDGCTCYVTMADSGSIESFRTDTPGQSWQLFHDREDAVAEAQPAVFRPVRIVAAAPNPFNATTGIEYVLRGNAFVECAVYNVLGQRVALLRRGPEKAGSHAVSWRAGDAPSGVYFVRIQADGVSASRKVMLLK